MNAHEALAGVLALARTFGNDSKALPEHAADSRVLVALAVGCAKLGLEIEKEFRLQTPPQSVVCARCLGARVSCVVDEGTTYWVVCPRCRGSGVRT